MTTQTDWINETTRELPALMTAPEAARALRMSPRNLKRLIAAGRIKAIKTAESSSARVLVPRASIASYLAGCTGEEPTERVKRAPARKAT